MRTQINPVIINLRYALSMEDFGFSILLKAQYH